MIMDKYVYFAKMNPNAVIPTKRDEDGCYDIYACFNEDYIEIIPHTIKLIPTGIASSFSKEYRIGIRERGSTGTKGLAYRAGQIDSGYRGEWFIPINNTTNKLIVIAKKEYVAQNPFLVSSDWITVYPYEKAICQAALERVPQIQVKEITYETLLGMESERGSGRLGSSGK